MEKRGEKVKKTTIRSIHKKQSIIDLHDWIISNLEGKHKKGVMDLLDRNSLSFKKILYPYLLMCGIKDIKGFMNTIDGLLEAHTKECYTIGYMDAIEGRQE